MKKVYKNINKISIKYFDNKSEQLSLRSNELFVNGGTKFSYELDDPSINNFYEFYIDDIMLIKYFLDESRYLGFLSDFNGLLGAFDKITDELLVNALLGKKLSKKLLLKVYEKANIELNKEWIEFKLAHYNNPRVHIYGCKICGSRDCGGIFTNVHINENIVTWNLGEEHEFNFALKQYNDELNKFLKSLR